MHISGRIDAWLEKVAMYCSLAQWLKANNFSKTVGFIFQK
jgi:hypothetical protein